MYSIDDIGDFDSGTLGDFIKAYRDSLKAQRDSNIKQLNQQRRNAQVSLMGAANRRGTLYSNFPQRDKIRYDTETYMPAYIRAQEGYQSGLDSLRANAVNLWNKIKTYKEAISDYDSDIV